MILSVLPNELKGLTLVEETLIARAVSFMHIYLKSV